VRSFYAQHRAAFVEESKAGGDRQPGGRRLNGAAFATLTVCSRLTESWPVA